MDNFALAIPILALLIPIVAILTRHQQKMAEVLHQNQVHHQVVPPQLEAEISQLRQEINRLKEVVHRQAIEMDDLRGLNGKAVGLPTSSEVQ